MIVKYFPKLNPDQSQIPGQEIAFAVLIPDSYTSTKKWILEIATHGMGERSGGTLENLKNLVLGPDYDSDGDRDGAAFVTADMKKAVDRYGIVMFIPTYSNFFEPNMVNYVYDYAMSHYNLYPKMIYTGFSLGGGSGIKYGTSNESNARRVGLLILCAPTLDIIDKTIPGRVGLPVHCFHNDGDPNNPNDGDPKVPASNSRTIVSKINESNPAIRAQYTFFNQGDHGGNIEAWALTPPVAPGGQGVLDASENIYQWGTDCIINGPRQMRSGTAVIQPPPVIEAPPTVTPITSYTIDEKGIHLVGDKSIGYKTGGDGRWELLTAPSGVTKAQVFPGGSTYINADGKLPEPGTYVFQFSLKGAVKPVEVTVQHGEAVKTFSGFNSTTDLITYSDGTTEKGEATFLQGKWTVKTAGGKVIL